MSFAATIDFETYSMAGFIWNAQLGKWRGPSGASQSKKGLSVVGAAVYAQHPSTRILTLSYFLPGNTHVQQWQPGMAAPQDLLDWICQGGLIEAHNVMFERLIWHHVATRLHGWSDLRPDQLRCSMATARVNNYPGKLENLGDVLQLDVKKDKEGKRLLTKFSMPRNPTKADPRLFIDPAQDEEGPALYRYCDTDVLSEVEASKRMLPMSQNELRFWLIDQEINWRGLGTDRKGVRDCIVILNQALERYSIEYKQITNGLAPSQIQATRGWLAGRGVYCDSLDGGAVDAMLSKDSPPYPPDVRRVLEIRSLVGSASVKKLFAMDLTASPDDRIRNLIVHHGARTGRPTGEGAQPLNMPKAGPKLATCQSCDRPHAPTHQNCPWCGVLVIGNSRPKWSFEMAESVLEIMAMHSLDTVEYYFGDAVLSIMGCVRSLFTAGPGHELIASDYSAIEAVVMAMLSGEQWRIDEFMAGNDIYLAGAAKIMNRPNGAQFYIDWAEVNGENHPDRQKIGKVSELGLGFGGWINAWRVFDSTDAFSDDEVKGHILAWRAASPAIIELWGGQCRGTPWQGSPERYGFEGAAIDAIQYPGMVHTVRGIKFEVRNNKSNYLVVTLLSGRELLYHEPLLSQSNRPYASPGELQITYMTWNTNPKYGALGWVRMSTFGGRLAENIVQAIAHDILRFAIENLKAAGFDTVLHVYDEIIVEVPQGGTDAQIAQVETIMGIMPDWAAGWPVRAAGGWRGKRYRKA